mmetsp:Transcript_25698/g.67241  ORF Transcript_25698/g.67241 Transcript_25698/m.67241 type:complete len:207 (+) Transcript_25698:649-1269(+)
MLLICRPPRDPRCSSRFPQLSKTRIAEIGDAESLSPIVQDCHHCCRGAERTNCIVPFPHHLHRHFSRRTTLGHHFHISRSTTHHFLSSSTRIYPHLLPRPHAIRYAQSTDVWANEKTVVTSSCGLLRMRDLTCPRHHSQRASHGREVACRFCRQGQQVLGHLLRPPAWCWWRSRQRLDVAQRHFALRNVALRQVVGPGGKVRNAED